MNKEEVIKELLQDFFNYVNIQFSVIKDKDEIEIKVIFKKKHNLIIKNVVHDRLIVMSTQIGKITGYLGSLVTYDFIFKRRKIIIQCTFFLAKIQDIGTIEEAVYHNIKKALEICLENK